MRGICFRCQGGGIDLSSATATPGQLMPICGACGGAGAVGDDEAPGSKYRAAFLVGSRFIVRITMPRQKGGFVEMDVDWSPRLPPAKGPGKLRPTERRDYEAGRTQAMQQFMAQIGGGEFSLVQAGERH